MEKSLTGQIIGGIGLVLGLILVAPFASAGVCLYLLFLCVLFSRGTKKKG